MLGHVDVALSASSMRGDERGKTAPFHHSICGHHNRDVASRTRINFTLVHTILVTNCGNSNALFQDSTRPRRNPTLHGQLAIIQIFQSLLFLHLAPLAHWIPYAFNQVCQHQSCECFASAISSCPRQLVGWHGPWPSFIPHQSFIVSFGEDGTR